MAKLTLSDIGNLENENSAVATMDSNSAAIETALENTLSRDGTGPNQMLSSFDMNSHQIINLPAPATANSPLRLSDLTSFISGGTVTNIPAGGIAGQVLGKVSDDDFDVSWRDTQHTASILDFGALGDGTTDDAPALRAAVAALINGGTVLVPPCANGYLLNSVVNNAVLDLTGSAGNKSISIVGEGWSYNSVTAPSGSVFKLGPNITSSHDFIHWAGTATVTNVNLKNFAVCDYQNVYQPRARDTIYIDGTVNDNFGLDHALIENLFLGISNRYSIHTAANPSTNNGGGAFANSKILKCQVGAINLTSTGDHVTVEDNIIGPNEGETPGLPGIFGSNVQGATSLLILNNLINSFNGMIILDQCTTAVIAFNELEMSAGVPNTYGSLIELRGTGGANVSALVMGNCISQNSAIGDYIPLKIDNSVSTFVHSNRFAQTTNHIQPISITANAVNTLIGHNTSYLAGVLQANEGYYNTVSSTTYSVVARDGTGSITIPGRYTSTLNNAGPGAGFLASADNAAIAFQNLGNSADQRTWDILSQVGTGTLQFRASDDANVSSTTWMTATRGSGFTVSGVTIVPPLTLSGAGALGTPASIVLTNATGTAASLTAGHVTTNANLTGDITSVGNATTLTNAPVIAKVLTGYVSGAGTVSASDSILSAIQKLNGNDGTNANLTGDVTSVGNATTLTNAPVIAKVLTGYTSGAGTVSASDSIISAIQKLNGNDATNANLTGDVTSVGNATTLTNAPVIAKVLTGYTSGAGTVSSADSILSAIQKLNGNNATNANLTGPITSVGNATSIASQTGTGTKFVVDTTPTINNPNIVGTATNDNAAAGSVGEYIESSVPVGSVVALTSTTAKTVTSITLSAGDWDVSGDVYISPAATTSMTQTAGSISTTTNTIDFSPGRFSQKVFSAVITAGFGISEPIPPTRFSVTGSTTVFLVAQATFTISTNGAYGIIRARRVR